MKPAGAEIRRQSVSLGHERGYRIGEVGVQTDAEEARPVALPSPDVLAKQLQARLSKQDATACTAALPLKDLLEIHPAFTQLLAKSPELRSVIEAGAEELLPHSLDQTNGVAGAHVLWTICTCVWKGMGVMLDSFGRKIPGNAAGPSEQFRLLMQSNNDLRSQLSTCRRDYLRELTELRERCRQLEPCCEEALSKLLREEPVMFFEPLDFVFEEPTKEFIRETVEEKLRLLMLRGWAKVDPDEVKASTERIEELEAEVAALRATSGRPRGPSMEIGSAFFDKSGFATVDFDGLCDEELASTRCSTAATGSTEMGGSLECSPRVEDSSCPNCSVLQGKLIKLCARLQQTMGRHAMKEAIAYAGLSEEIAKQVKKPKAKKETAFDRLYADAQRRVDKIRTDADEVHALQASEISSCEKLAAHSEPARKKLGQVKGMHSKYVASNSALHDAFDTFHSENCNAEDTHSARSGGLQGRECESSLPDVEPGKHAPMQELVDHLAKHESLPLSPSRLGKISRAEVTISELQAEVSQRMQKLRGQVEDIQMLQTAELGYCFNAPYEANGKITLDSLQTLHTHSVTSATVLQEALDTLHVDVTEAAANDCGKDATQSPSKSGRGARGGRGTKASDGGELDVVVSTVDSPERKRLFAQSDPFRQPPLQRMQPLPGLAASTSSLGGLNPHEHVLLGSHVSHSSSPEKKKTAGLNSLAELPQSSSPAKKKTAGLNSLNDLPHSSSPEKKKTASSFNAFGELKSELAHSSSPEKRKGLNSFAEDSASLMMSGVSHSSSPEKRKKRSAVGGAHLDPLRRAPKPIAPLCEVAGSLSAPGSIVFLAGGQGKETGTGFLRCSTPPFLVGSSANIASVSNLQEQERGRNYMKKSESLPTLRCCGTAPAKVG